MVKLLNNTTKYIYFFSKFTHYKLLIMKFIDILNFGIKYHILVLYESSEILINQSED